MKTCSTTILRLNEELNVITGLEIKDVILKLPRPHVMSLLKLNEYFLPRSNLKNMQHSTNSPHTLFQPHRPTASLLRWKTRWNSPFFHLLRFIIHSVPISGTNCKKWSFFCVEELWSLIPYQFLVWIAKNGAFLPGRTLIICSVPVSGTNCKNWSFSRWMALINGNILDLSCVLWVTNGKTREVSL